MMLKICQCFLCYRLNRCVVKHLSTSNNTRLVLCYSYCIVAGKNRYTPHGRSLEIPRGKGVLKDKLLEANYEAKLESLEEGGGGKTENLLWGE